MGHANNQLKYVLLEYIFSDSSPSGHISSSLSSPRWLSRPFLRFHMIFSLYTSRGARQTGYSRILGTPQMTLTASYQYWHHLAAGEVAGAVGSVLYSMVVYLQRTLVNYCFASYSILAVNRGVGLFFPPFFFGGGQTSLRMYILVVHSGYIIACGWRLSMDSLGLSWSQQLGLATSRARWQGLIERTRACSTWLSI